MLAPVIISSRPLRGLLGTRLLRVNPLTGVSLDPVTVVLLPLDALIAFCFFWLSPCTFHFLPPFLSWVFVFAQQNPQYISFLKCSYLFSKSVPLLFRFCFVVVYVLAFFLQIEIVPLPYV